MTSRMERELQGLRESNDPHARGFAFQAFIADLFRGAQFEVTPSAGAAAPRQTDLVARRGPDSFLVETKWVQGKADSGDIDALLARLRRTSNEVTGVFFSYSGYTGDAFELVRHERYRPILLFEGSELDEVARDDLALLRLLHQKRELLVTHGVVHTPHQKRPARPKSTDQLPASQLAFLLSGGTRSSEFASAGEYDKSVYVLELPDIDWTPGTGAGVTLDLSLGVETEKDLVGLLHKLADMGWVRETDHLVRGVGCWSIQQATTNWHGHGCQEFAAAIRDWKRRYSQLAKDALHHTEEFVYFDTFGLGYFTLFGQISADQRRFVWRTNMSFQLMGIPVDDGAFRHLCSRFSDEEAFYRPRTSASVLRRHLKERPKVTPQALLVKPMDGEDWVVGIVVANPYHGRRPLSDAEGQLPRNISDSAVLVCSLRSWHQLRGPKRTYRLWELEWSDTSSATAVRPVAEWDTPRSRAKQTGDTPPGSIVIRQKVQ